MLEGFVHLKRKLPREFVKKIVNMDMQYLSYNKSILFIIDEKKIEHSVKEYLLKKFSFIKDYVDNIIVFLNDKTDKSKTLIFNYKKN